MIYHKPSQIFYLPIWLIAIAGNSAAAYELERPTSGHPYKYGGSESPYVNSLQ